jgi:hypothetical protein
MATPFDISLLRNFQIIFPFIFIFTVVYAVLSYSKILGEGEGKNWIYAMIAAVMAFMSLFSDTVTQTISVAAPWFILLFVFILFIIMAFMVLGVREANVLNLIKDPEYSFVGWWVAALVIIIMVGSLSHVISSRGGYPPYGENATVEEGETQESSFWATFFHPKILGMLAILLIAFFTISRLTSAPR